MSGEDLQELREVLAERSHIGWMEEKQRQGFHDHPFERDPNHTGHPMLCVHCGEPQRIGFHPENKHHPDMLPYADLAENVKDYDRKTVDSVLAGIEAAGYRIIKANSMTAHEMMRAALEKAIRSHENLAEVIFTGAGWRDYRTEALEIASDLRAALAASEPPTQKDSNA